MNKSVPKLICKRWRTTPRSAGRWWGRIVGLLAIAAFGLAACGGGGGDGDGGVGSSPTNLAGSLPLFEDFSSGAIDGTKWTMLSFNTGVVQACTQPVVSGVFMTSQAYTNDAGDCGLEFTNSINVASFSSEITVTDFMENPAEGPIRARLRGIFYNDAFIANSGSLSFESDIFAQIYSKGTVVEASVRRCTATNCMSVLLFGETQLGTITLGSTHTLFLGWDGGTTFTFQLDSLTPVIFDALDALPDPAPNMGPPLGGTLPGSKVVELRGGSPFATGSITATFDNIRCATTGGGSC